MSHIVLTVNDKPVYDSKTNPNIEPINISSTAPLPSADSVKKPIEYEKIKKPQNGKDYFYLTTKINEKTGFMENDVWKKSKLQNTSWKDHGPNGSTEWYEMADGNFTTELYIEKVSGGGKRRNQKSRKQKRRVRKSRRNRRR